MNVGAKWARFKLDAVNAAKSLIAGLVNGINEGAQWVVDAVKSMANNVVLGMKTVLGIASPSKVMAGLGDMTTAGFMQGLEPLDGLNPLAGVDPSLPVLDPLAGLRGLEKTNPLAGITPPVNDNAAAWGERPMAGPVSGVGAGAQAGAAAAAGQGTGGIASVNFAPVFNVQQQPGQDGAALADDLQQRMRGEFNSMLEEMALETGS
jgi:hypothetical protein